VKHWWNGIGRRVTETFGENPLLLLVFLTQIPHGLAWIDPGPFLWDEGGCKTFNACFKCAL